MAIPEDLKVGVEATTTEGQEARTPEVVTEQADGLAAIVAEMNAESSKVVDAATKQATEMKQPEQKQEQKSEETKVVEAEKVGEKPKDGVEPAKVEPLDLSEHFPLEVELKDGKKITVESADEFVTYVEAGKDRVNWDKSLHARGRELNQEKAALLEKQARFEALEAENAELRRFKVDIEGVRALPALPPKPDRRMLDPTSDIYDLKKYGEMEDAYEAAKEARAAKQVELTIQRATAPATQAPLNPLIPSAANAAEEKWFAEQKDLTPELHAKIVEAAVPRFQQLLQQLDEANKARRPGEPLNVIGVRDVYSIYNEAKAEVSPVKKPSLTASESGTRAVLRAIKRAKEGPQPSKPAESAKSEVDPFDESVSVADYEKALKQGKVKVFAER